MEAFARPPSSSRVVPTKRPKRAAAKIDISAVGLEAAARAGSYNIRRAKPPWRRRTTAQIHSRRAKKTTLSPLRPPSSNNHHHRPNLGLKQQSRPYAVSRAQISSRRGLADDSTKISYLCAKRARTDLHCPPNNNNNWRDWANVDDGPAGIIAERVLAYDVADYVRFRAVCRPWRQCSTEPRSHSGLDRRFHPWRWTMLREELAAPDRRCFINTSTGECVKVDIPELSDYELLALTPEGLLVLANKPPHTTTVCLLNPLTRHLIQLPPLSTLVPSEDHDAMLPERDGLSLQSDFTAWGSGIASDDSTVVLCFHQLNMLGIAKPGDDHWTLLDYDGDGMTTAPIMFEGRFYCVNFSGIMVLETGAPPRLELVAKLNMNVCVMADTFHLVNNGRELILVHRHGGWKKSGHSYDTYHVDFDTGTLLPVNTLGGPGRALFLGMLCSLSVSLEGFPSGSITADTIYLSFDMYERVLLKVGAYHLVDGRVELPNSSVPRPHTLAECLSLANTVS